MDVAELAGVGDLLQLRDARVVLEQVADHQRSARSPRPPRPRARRRRPTAPAASRRSSACRRAARARRARRGVGHGRGEHDGVELGVAEQVVELAGEARARERARVALARRLGGVAAPGQLAAREGGEVARQVRAPVAEARDAQSDRHALHPKRGHDAFARPAVAVERRPLGRRLALQRGQRGGGVEVDQHVPARVDRLGPLGGGAQRDARRRRPGRPPSARRRSRSAPRARAAAAR